MIKTLSEENLNQMCVLVAARDKRLGAIYEQYGTPPLWKREPNFATLVHIILEQQVSLASALSAFNKLQAKLVEISPAGVLTLSDEEMRAYYFSRQKTAYVRGLAAAILDQKLNLELLQKLPDAEVKIELKKIKGIGDWTADIFLLMALLRVDVMPKGDLALHIAYRNLYALESAPKSDEFQLIAEKWQPLRAVAARLLWHFYLSVKAPRKAGRLDV